MQLVDAIGHQLTCASLAPRLGEMVTGQHVYQSPSRRNRYRPDISCLYKITIQDSDEAATYGIAHAKRRDELAPTD